MEMSGRLDTAIFIEIGSYIVCNLLLGVVDVTPRLVLEGCGNYGVDLPHNLGSLKWSPQIHFYAAFP
jgi:hypothetical protein